MRVRSDVERQHAVAGEHPPHDIDGVMRREAACCGTQRALKRAPVLLDRTFAPGIRTRFELCEGGHRGIKVADDLICDFHGGVDVGRLQIDMEHGYGR